MRSTRLTLSGLPALLGATAVTTSLPRVAMLARTRLKSGKLVAEASVAAMSAEVMVYLPVSGVLCRPC